ncbi:type II toxin-antitoxin system VapB family antitoxin [Cyanobium sp. CH-040]|uniref:type II toxin-antitoxin system VapB family antitoxin n=1 Tax=Cyanobium sp. CH-040 TaxID=2823708 RepID=UPI0020CEEA3F|nr:type II toxin-antitoxin system VapB family antitoxin [Cyanobium sp. CH-040]MCP9926350.1 AbrB/MazE/SpoVT family DNA-binding domain-containing protein [Cyanobium sp. CH-040]
MYIQLVVAKTRLFRNGHSQAVRIPAELAYEHNNLELEIERIGDEIRIRPAARPITGALAALASFSPTFLAGGREQDQKERPSL